MLNPREGYIQQWNAQFATTNNIQNFPSILSSRINKTQWEIGQGYQGNNWVRRKV